MSRIELTPTKDGFTLSRDGEMLAALSDDDVLALANTAENFRQTIMTRFPKGAVYASPVTTVLVRSDALGEKVLVQFGTAPSGQTIFELERSLGADLLQQLLDLSAPSFDDGPKN
jgi:hypothetical protein